LHLVGILFPHINDDAAQKHIKFHLAFGNVGILNKKAENRTLHSDFQYSPFEATGFGDEQYSSFITTRMSLPRVDPPIVGPLPE